MFLCSVIVGSFSSRTDSVWYATLFYISTCGRFQQQSVSLIELYQLETALVNVVSGIACTYVVRKSVTIHSQLQNKSEWNKKKIEVFRPRTITLHHINQQYQKKICALLDRKRALQLVPDIHACIHAL